MTREEITLESTNRQGGGGAVRRCACDACGSGSRTAWRVCAAEALGTALLVLLTCLPGCGAAAATDPFYRAVASGFVVVVLVQSLDHISGAMLNPTVTLAAVLWGRVSRWLGLAMMTSQVAGATVGGAALHLLEPRDVPALCVTQPIADLSIYKAVCIEAVLGGCLALANCASWDARNDGLRDSWPLRIGMSVAALSLVGGELTGASMNPVRSFGPALWSNNWTHHWVYWAGPLSGSAVFTAIYIGAWRPRTCHAKPRNSVIAPHSNLSLGPKH